MADISVYLIPETLPAEPRSVRAKIIRVLQDLAVIDQSRSHFYPDSDESECFNVGDNNLDAFNINEDEVDVAFQDCEIYGHPTEISIPPGDGGDDAETYLTNVFVGFHDTSGYSSVKPDWLDAFQAQLGIRFRVLEHWS